MSRMHEFLEMVLVLYSLLFKRQGFVKYSSMARNFFVLRAFLEQPSCGLLRVTTDDDFLHRFIGRLMTWHLLFL